MEKNTTNVTKETGFAALPGGTRFDAGNFTSEGSQRTWWSATKNGTMKHGTEECMIIPVL